MTIQELLGKANYDNIGKIAEQRENQWHPPEKQLTAEEYGKAYESFSKMLQGLKANPSKDILLACTYYDDDHEPEPDVNMYVKEDVINSVDTLLKTRNDPVCILLDDLPNMTTEELSNLVKKIAEPLPQSYGYEFSEWEDTLGAEVLPANVVTIGTDMFVYRVLYEMSFNGMTREHQQERRAELDASIAELDEILQLPEEEQHAHLHNIDDLFEELGWHDTRTEEEKEAEIHAMYVDSVKSNINICNMLLAIADDITSTRR